MRDPATRNISGLKPPFTRNPNPEQAARMLSILRKRAAIAEARQHRHKGLDCPRYDRQHYSKRKGPMFSHLPPDKQPIARAKFESYKLKHKAKLDSLQGLAKVRYLGCLAACASAHATRVEHLHLSSKRSRAVKRYCNQLRTLLGLQEKHPFTITRSANPDGSHRSRINNGGVYANIVAANHPGHGKPLEAEAGSTDMSGV